MQFVFLSHRTHMQMRSFVPHSSSHFLCMIDRPCVQNASCHRRQHIAADAIETPVGGAYHNGLDLAALLIWPRYRGIWMYLGQVLTQFIAVNGCFDRNACRSGWWLMTFELWPFARLLKVEMVGGLGTEWKAWKSLPSIFITCDALPWRFQIYHRGLK